MPDALDLLAQLVGERPSLPFGALLVVHIAAGLCAVAAGALAALSPKRRGRHPRAGTVYYGALAIVFLTAAGLSALRWSEDAYLFVLGVLAFAAGSIGSLARHNRWAGWKRTHIVGMGTSYIVLLTAFYVDNGPRLPVWDQLPVIAFWLLPSVVGVPLIVRAMRRHARMNSSDEFAQTIATLARADQGSP